MDIFDLYAKITLDSKGYTTGIDEASAKFNSFKAGLGSALASIAKITAAAVTAGAAATAKIVKDAVANYGEYEQLVGGIETLFKESAGTVQANAEKAFATAQISANQYMELVTSFSASLIQSTGNDTQRAAKLADQAIIDMSDNANKMGYFQTEQPMLNRLNCWKTLRAA